MTIDKRWTTLRNRNSDEFWDGLNKFIEIIKEQADIDGLVRCPCGDCLNTLFHTPNTIHAHIHRKGFQQSYQQWIYHGEVVPPVVDEVVSTTYEMVDVLNDLVGEQNTNDDSDEGNLDDGGTTIDEEFAELFEEMNTELYPGCTWLSSLTSTANLLHMKAMNKWTHSSFDQLMKFLKFAFPKDNKIPSSYYEAKKKMRKMGLGYETIHVCKHDCCLFWKEHASKDNCPVCGDSRWDENKTTGKKVPHKVLRYFPLTPRLRRLYSSRHTAKEMTWHKTGRSEEGKMRHPVDGTAWKDFDAKYPDFAKEPRNIRLALAADGFNPFGSLTNPHSTWPVILTTYNTPPWLCMKESSMMLTLLIPGPRSPGKDMDVFLRPLVDELKVLWGEGVKVKDAATNTVFTMHAALLWTINDFPARSSLSGWSGQGYKACPTCNEDTPSCRVKRKTAYVGHRRFLPTRHHWRSSRLFNGKSERRGPPKRFSPTIILRQLAYVQIRKPGKHPRVGGVKRPRDSKELNWSKKSIFYELKYWSSLPLKHNLDVMHIEKNVCDSLLGTLLMNENSKDTTYAREDLKDLGIRKEDWLQESDNKTTKPHPKYSFTVENRKKFCQFIKGVKLPDGFGSNFKRKVNENCSNITGLKSHDCHILMQRLLPIRVRGRGYLDKNIATTICELCTFFKQICARTLDVEDNGSRPLPVEFDISYEGTYYPLGKNGTMMNSLIGTLVRTHIPPYYFTWDVVPDEDKARILPRVESFFDIGRNTRNWERINEGINRYCGRRYSNRKSKLHDHFKTQGGPNNVDRARRNPPPSLRPVDWNKLIDDVFMDSNWQDRSKQNSNNRKNQPFPSFHGTQSYVNARFKKMNPETRQIQGAIDNWHDNHYKEIGGWPNKAAKLAYEKLVAEREKEVQSQQASSSSSSNGITVNEREIFQKVFGERRGHTVGIGRKLKRPSGLPSSSTTSAPVSYETMQKTIQEVVRVTQEASDRHHEERSRKWSEDFISQLSQIIPSVNFATFQPFESTPAPPFDYNAFVGSTNEVSQQQSGDDDEEECMNEND